MDEQRVPDLEGMDEQQAEHFLTEMFTHLSAEAEYEMRHDDYVMDMPQSGERIRGRDTRYYAEPFEAPEWPTQWVERS